MTGGANCGGRRRTRLETIGVSPRGALPTYIKEGDGGGRPLGARHKGVVLLGLLVLVGFGPPSFPSHGGGKGEGEGVGEGKGGGTPFP